MISDRKYPHVLIVADMAGGGAITGMPRRVAEWMPRSAFGQDCIRPLDCSHSFSVPSAS